MNKEKIYMGLWIIFVISFCVFLSIIFGAEYINRPFGQPCYENHTESIGDFRTCGSLMSGETAKGGLLLIFIGLPLLAFVILPLLVRLKKHSQSANKGKKK